MSPRFPFTLPKFSDKYRSVSNSPRVKVGAAAVAALAAAGIATTVATSAAPTASAANDLSAAGRTAQLHNPARHQAGNGHATAAAAHATPSASHSAASPGKASHSPASHSPAPAKHAPAKAPAKKAPAKHAAPKAPVHKPAPAHKAPARKPYLIYDSVTPSALPSHHEIAIYSNGSYAAPRGAAAGRPMLYIDTNGSNPNASVLDVEPGDATPTQAASWARARLSANPHALARIYTMRSEWAATKAAVDTLPASMRSRVRWWIADPTGVPHIVPGSDATQWYWGSSYDISTATPKFG